MQASVIINNNLILSDYIVEVFTKLCFCGCNKKKLFFLLKTNAMCFSLVYPHSIYSNETWGCTNQTQLGRLKKVLIEGLKKLSKAPTTV